MIITKQNSLPNLERELANLTSNKGICERKIVIEQLRLEEVNSRIEEVRQQMQQEKINNP
jgi:hypothetical protein